MGDGWTTLDQMVHPQPDERDPLVRLDRTGMLFFFFTEEPLPRTLPPELRDLPRMEKNGRVYFRVSMDEYRSKGPFVRDFTVGGITMNRIVLHRRLFHEK